MICGFYEFSVLCLLERGRKCNSYDENIGEVLRFFLEVCDGVKLVL